VGLPAFRPQLAGAAPVLVGPVVGLATFAALAGRPRRPRAIDRVVAARALWLSAGAAFEELVWRGFLLGALALRIGVSGALLASSAAFALAHRGRTGRPTHLFTGLAFGSAFVCAGLVAAIGAHAAYNVLVDLAVQAEREPG